MATQYNEQALESLIEKSLTGYCLEELKAENTSIDRVQELQKQYLKGTGYYIGAPSDSDKKYALDTLLQKANAEAPMLETKGKDK